MTPEADRMSPHDSFDFGGQKCSSSDLYRLPSLTPEDVATLPTYDSKLTSNPDDTVQNQSSVFSGATEGNSDETAPSNLEHTVTMPSMTDLTRPAANGQSNEDSDSSGGEDWKPEEASSDDDDGEFGNAGFEFVRRYCKNCTQRLSPFALDECIACAHQTVNDAVLLGDDLAGARLAADERSFPWTVPSPRRPALAWDESMELHEEVRSGSPHPERPDRVKAAIARVIAAGAVDRCDRLPVREATREELEACHTPDLIDKVFSSAEFPHYFTSDTYSNEHTASAARLAAGACVDVTVAVATGKAPCGTAICRPPGHHAESSMAMGFCFFNNAAVAARAAQRAGAGRVLIMDWDVHHGNGTQHIFEDDDSVMYMSIHRYDGGNFFPGTGSANEVGIGKGKGYTVNIPWDDGGATNGDYLAAFNQLVLPIAYEFNPDLVIISAGFDAAKGDPIGGCNVTPEAFGHMAAMLQMVAPTSVLLEGGYNLTATAASVEQVLRVLLGERPAALPRAPIMTPVGRYAIANAQMVQMKYWTNLGASRLCSAAAAQMAPSLSPVRAPLAIPSPARLPPSPKRDSVGLDTPAFGDDFVALEGLNGDVGASDGAAECSPFLGGASDALLAEPLAATLDGATDMMGSVADQQTESVKDSSNEHPAVTGTADVDNGQLNSEMSELRRRISLDDARGRRVSEDGAMTSRTSPKRSSSLDVLGSKPTVMIPTPGTHHPKRAFQPPPSPGGGSYRRWQLVRSLQESAMKSLFLKRKAAKLAPSPRHSGDGCKAVKMSHSTESG